MFSEWLGLSSSVRLCCFSKLGKSSTCESESAVGKLLSDDSAAHITTQMNICHTEEINRNSLNGFNSSQQTETDPLLAALYSVLSDARDLRFHFCTGISTE